MTGSGMRSPEMRKKRRLRSVCAPHSRAAGTSIGPKLSFSMRMAAIPAAMLRANGGQVEEQHFGALARRELERALVGLERVARREALAVDADGAARDMHVRHAAGAELVARLLRAVEQAGIDARVLVHAHRALGAVGRGDEAQAAALVASAQLVHFCCWLACGWPACCWLATSACTLAMSSAFAWVMTCSSALPGSAPAC